MSIRSAIRDRMEIIRALKLAFNDYREIVRYSRAARKHIENKYGKAPGKVKLNDINPYFAAQGDSGQPDSAVPAMLFEENMDWPKIVAVGISSELKLKKGVR